ncbi:dihydrofolate reductase family protein [Algoriphagus marincola]|uniref:dihydrofolate reductase family protein n=1 Tax=Algoriphagus marincola TaxID=264027 RepID=UPI0004214F02|nr:hypothetical protein [Algoriphagus marincola]
MKKKNKVFIGCSLDGFIADQKGGIDWLDSIPNPDQNDMGYGEFMEGVDALLMGRNTFLIPSWALIFPGLMRSLFLS